MENIKILGTGCSKCRATMKVVETVAKEHNFTGQIEKVEDIAQIIGYGVISTPAIIIDEKIVFTGGVPSKEQVESWFNYDSSCCKY